MFKKKQKINSAQIINFGLLGAGGEAVYIFSVAWLMTFLEEAMPKLPAPPLGTTVFLLIFVLSAAISAILVFGYPIYLGFQKRFAEGLMTVVVTIATLIVIGLFILLLLPII